MAPSDTSAASAADLLPGAAEQARARILVVDDDPRNLLAVKTLLEDIAEVVLASSGEEALRHLLREDFAVILLDVFMPGMDGYETAQMIRSREQTKRIPIVFLSAVNKESEHLLRGYSMGAVDYVFKPFEPVVLQSKVAVFVDLFLVRREIQRKALQEQALLDAALKSNAEKLRVEQELRLSEQRQAAIISSLPIILYIEPVDGERRVPQFVAGNFEALTGFTLEEVQARPGLWQERLHPDDRERVLGTFAARSSAGRLALEYRWQCADGSWKHFLDQAAVLPDTAGGPPQLAGTLLDITDRKGLESQLNHVRKMDAIGKLTGGIAHDFNNLLAAVLGGLALLDRRAELADEHRRILTMTRHAAEQGTTLVSRLLAFARRQQLEPRRVDIQALAAAVRDLLSHTLGGLVELAWEPDPALWDPYADDGQLELALMNLIINARDAMPDGGTIRVECENRSVAVSHELGLSPGDYVILAVVDQGSGIPPELLDQVLEPFFTTKDVGKGTGLGLSMVYGFVKQSGGALHLSSEVGRGTRVEIWLPRAPEGAPADLIEAPVEVASAGSAGLRVLLVDDHEQVRATTAAILADLGHQVTTAASAQGALDLLSDAAGEFDVLVSDYAMPHMSGAELIQSVRELRPHFPALLITGYADAASISTRPADVPLLSKPFTPEQIALMIRNAASARAMTAAA